VHGLEIQILACRQNLVLEECRVVKGVLAFAEDVIDVGSVFVIHVIRVIVSCVRICVVVVVVDVAVVVVVVV
jgi:hypothetical protein